MAKVLVVDDEPEVRKAIVAALQAGGHETAEACDGVSALDGVVEHHPDVLLCDWMLPGLFGGEVVQRLRNEPEYEAFRELPMVIVSDFADDTSEEKFKRVGADAFVAKCEDLGQFHQALLQGIETALRTRGRA